jgi:arylsulfatase A-like enzyme
MIRKAVSFVILIFPLAAHCGSKPLNFVYIIVDDLRPTLHAYGADIVSSPNIDRLANEGVLFERAFANVPVCGASRASIMTGLRPTAKRFTQYYSRADKDSPKVPTLPAYLKNHGYYTVSLGKVFHKWQDSQVAWSEKPWLALKSDRNNLDYQDPVNLEGFRDFGIRPPTEGADVSDDAYVDGRVAAKATVVLEELKKRDQPFFLAIGLEQTHLPFHAPTRYWDLYERSQIPLPSAPNFPRSAPEAAWHDSSELRYYSGIPEAPREISDELARALIHGYYASISYVDAQVGRILDVLDRLGFRQDTVVILSGDHGISLGEHSLWGKKSTFDVTAHTPLILSAPGIEGGKRIPWLVEFVDIYPSVLELASLPIPSHLEGKQFVDSLHDAESQTKEAIYHRFGLADAVRTTRFSYTVWFGEDYSVRHQMLYDLQEDPFESVNVADDPDYLVSVSYLRKLLTLHARSRDTEQARESK